MVRRRSLSRRLILSMGLVSLITTLIGFVGSFIIYTLLYWNTPPEPELSTEGFTLEPVDYLIAWVLLLLGLIASVVIALRLTRRLLVPLDSLAEGARRIAAGDLSVRATPGDRSLGETAQLVDDFNSMAVRLEDMASDVSAWNAAIAHELRTPLTILSGRLQGVKDGVFEPSERLIDGLIDQVNGLTRLVEDLRTVTLQDSGHLALHIAPVRLADEIRLLLDTVQPQLTAAGMAVELSLIDTPVVCDAARIRQALAALLDNARRYAGQGTLRVALFSHRHEITLRVEDSGPGLTPDFARLAFDPFTRAESSRLRQLGGSGLGLSVVRAVALAHGGSVQYCSSPEGGARFDLTFPQPPARAAD